MSPNLSNLSHLHGEPVKSLSQWAQILRHQRNRRSSGVTVHSPGDWWCHWTSSTVSWKRWVCSANQKCWVVQPRPKITEPLEMINSRAGTFLGGEKPPWNSMRSIFPVMEKFLQRFLVFFRYFEVFLKVFQLLFQTEFQVFLCHFLLCCFLTLWSSWRLDCAEVNAYWKPSVCVLMEWWWEEEGGDERVQEDRWVMQETGVLLLPPLCFPFHLLLLLHVHHIHVCLQHLNHNDDLPSNGRQLLWKCKLLFCDKWFWYLLFWPLKSFQTSLLFVRKEWFYGRGLVTF